MRILVTLKRTPQRDARIRIAEGGDSLDLDNVQFEVNPFDELAVEEALRIRESRGEVEVVVVDPLIREKIKLMRAVLTRVKVILLLFT